MNVFFSKYALALKLAFIAVLLGAIGVQTLRLADAHTDLAKLQASVAQERATQTQNALNEAAVNVKETQRRLERQQENQRAQDAELAAARAAADRNAADADRVRQQSVAAAREWGARLADSPSREDIAAAAAAIDLCADVRGRLDRAAGEIAAYAGAAHAAGLKCERDYDALSETKK
jgi:hypothetical protein